MIMITLRKIVVILLYISTLKIINAKCCRCCCCDEEINKSNLDEGEYFLNSGLNIKVPLNLKWSQYKNGYNCSAIAVFRFILSDKVLLERFLKENLKQNSMKTKNTKELFSETSQLFKDILKTKDDYNERMYNIIEKLEVNEIFASDEILTRFLWIYFKDLFRVKCFSHSIYQEKNSKEFKLESSLGNSISSPFYFPDETYKLKNFMKTYKKTQSEAENIIKKLTENNINSIKEEFITSEYLYLYTSPTGSAYFPKPTVDGKEFTDWEKISITQKNGTIKEYELIGLMGLCGEIVNASVSDSDTVLIVPVYDKDKNKKGWVKYQFDKVSEVRELQYWKNIDKFGEWKNPTFINFIYRCKSIK